MYKIIIISLFFCIQPLSAAHKPQKETPAFSKKSPIKEDPRVIARKEIVALFEKETALRVTKSIIASYLDPDHIVLPYPIVPDEAVIQIVGHYQDQDKHVCRRGIAFPGSASLVIALNTTPTERKLFAWLVKLDPATKNSSGNPNLVIKTHDDFITKQEWPAKKDDPDASDVLVWYDRSIFGKGQQFGFSYYKPTTNVATRRSDIHNFFPPHEGKADQALFISVDSTDHSRINLYKKSDQKNYYAQLKLFRLLTQKY